jgi:hypothetical protein
MNRSYREIRLDIVQAVLDVTEVLPQSGSAADKLLSVSRLAPARRGQELPQALVEWEQCVRDLLVRQKDQLEGALERVRMYGKEYTV